MYSSSSFTSDNIPVAFTAYRSSIIEVLYSESSAKNRSAFSLYVIPVYSNANCSFPTLSIIPYLSFCFAIYFPSFISFRSWYFASNVTSPDVLISPHKLFFINITPFVVADLMSSNPESNITFPSEFINSFFPFSFTK